MKKVSQIEIFFKCISKLSSEFFFPEIISRFFRMRLLIPFSRVTYCAYLLNPILILFFTMSAQNTFHLDFYSIFFQTLGIIFSTYLAGCGLMLLFENPVIMIISKLTARSRE